jgi:hypothetical protein
MYNGVGCGHFTVKITDRKILDAKYQWPKLHKDVQMYCQSYDACSWIGNLSLASLVCLVVPPYRLSLS